MSQNFVLWFRRQDTRFLKAAFTLIYILIVDILSANKIIYKWPHLYFKTQIHK